METDRDRLSRLTGSEVLSIEPVAGGCIARAEKIVTTNGAWFAKSGHGDVAASLEAESDGLEVLGEAATGSDVLIPKVRAFEAETGGAPAILVMEWIEVSSWTDATWELLGRGVASLHRATRDRFGHHRDNFIGRLEQKNTPGEDWPGFYRECRLEPQVRGARSRGRWLADWDAPYERVCRNLDALLPARPAASLLHGDLWSGNVLASIRGRAALIDPAVYAGHRETDLAMARLFGGFPGRFFAAYDEAWAPDDGRMDRLPVYQLYHLLNHLNHFGEGYAAAVDRTLRNAI